MSAFAHAAVAYASAGIDVFPLQIREKKPLPRTPGLLGACKDPERVDRWWAGKEALPLKDGETRPIFAGHRCNVGIATGSRSGFWVLDLDGEEAEAGLAALVAVHGPLPATVEQSTGKGRHLFFAWDVRFVIRNSASKIGAKIDVRGDGGYIVAAPSIHPSGRVYTWAPGRSPSEIAFAPAPDWLLELACPPEPVAAPAAARPLAPRVQDGKGSRYGEAALDRACRDIAAAPPGRQNDTLYDEACSIGMLVAGGELELRYAASALESAGGAMATSGKPWTQKQIADIVERAFTWAADHPKARPARPDRSTAAPAPARASRTAVESAQSLGEARQLWGAARSPFCKVVSAWFDANGLTTPGALMAGLRYHEGENALLCPLVREPGEPVDALAVLPMQAGRRRFSRFVGEARGRAVLLGAPGRKLVVAIDFQDGWFLACRNAAPAAVVPTLSGFAGQPLGDQWGRVSLDMPRLDPASPPWTLPGREAVVIAVRGDLRPPPLRVRGVGGRSRDERLSGPGAARFYGALAEQGWRAAGANAVRLIGSPTGQGFNTSSNERAASNA